VEGCVQKHESKRFSRAVITCASAREESFICSLADCPYKGHVDKAGAAIVAPGGADGHSTSDTAGNGATAIEVDEQM
jgi:hypothetical protein